MNHPACLQATLELKRIFLFHSAIALFFVVIQRIGYNAILPVALVSFCNALCLAERFWAIQRKTMGHWPLCTRVCFLVSRVLVLVVVLFILAILLRGAVMLRSA